jgi:hypothetical protein
VNEITVDGNKIMEQFPKSTNQNPKTNFTIEEKKTGKRHIVIAPLLYHHKAAKEKEGQDQIPE